MSKETYIRGFCKAAETNGVDPKALAEYIQKSAKATPLTDTLGALVGSMVPYAGPLASIVGTQYGMLDRDRYEQQGAGKAFIPGVGMARLANRLKSQVGKEVRDVEKSEKDKDARPVRHALAEGLGTLPAILASTGVGAGAGALLGKGKGAAVGAGVGAGAGAVATLVGAIAAAVKRRRTAQEQIDNDKRTILRDLLVPGVAAYNSYKRLGRSQGDRDEAEKKGKTDKS